MKSLLLLFVVAILLLSVKQYASEQQADDVGHTFQLGVADFSSKSPSGKYYCVVKDRPGEEKLPPGQNVYLIFEDTVIP